MHICIYIYIYIRDVAGPSRRRAIRGARVRKTKISGSSNSGTSVRLGGKSSL